MIMFSSFHSVQYIVKSIPLSFLSFIGRIYVYIAVPTLTPNRQILCICE